MLQASNWVRPAWHAMGPILTALGVLVLIASPVGYRLGWFGVPVALLRLIPLGLGLCALGLVVSLIAIVRTPAGAGWSGSAAPWAAVIVSIAVCIIPILGTLHARQVPPIHDITTDTDGPPTFVALAGARMASPNGLDYGGPEVAAAQKAAYPDLKTLFSKLPPDALFARAQQAARDAGWQVAEANASQGRIEAVDTTLLYGFKDDIVVLIRSDVNGSRLDMRSVSRVGRSDLGVNAARMRSYLARLSQ
ncbi:MAG TPA: DUF1499 domain-containing protein [Burkholderiaceae bacterium]